MPGWSFFQELEDALALVDQEGSITTVVHKLVTAILVWHSHHLLCAPQIFWESLALHAKTVEVPAFAMAAAAWS